MTNPIIESYLECRYPEVNGELFREHSFDGLHRIIDAILDRAVRFGLSDALERANVSVESVQLISSLRAESAFIFEGTAAYVFLDYESYSLFESFCERGPTVEATLDRMAAEAYHLGNYELALRLRLAHHFEAFHSDRKAQPFCEESKLLPVFGHEYLMSSIVSHEIGHLFYHCNSLSGNLERSLQQVERFVAMAREATVGHSDDLVLMASLPESLRRQLLDFDVELDDTLIEEIYSDAKGATLKEATYHWGDTQEVQDGDALLGLVLVSGLSCWINSIKDLSSDPSIELTTARKLQERARYSTVLRASMLGERTIAVSPPLAAKIWTFIEKQSQVLSTREDCFYLEALIAFRKQGTDGAKMIDYVPTWMFLLYCDAVYESLASAVTDVIKECLEITGADAFSHELGLACTDDEAATAFSYLSGMDQLVDDPILKEVEARLPKGSLLPLPTWVPLMYQVSGATYREDC